MQRTKKCTKCQSDKVGYVSYQPDLGPDNAYSMRAIGVHLVTGPFQNWQDYIGTLEAYVCTSCGHYESYVANPARVDWSQIDGFQWVNLPKNDPQGPYR